MAYLNKYQLLLKLYNCYLFKIKKKLNKVKNSVDNMIKVINYNYSVNIVNEHIQVKYP